MSAFSRRLRAALFLLPLVPAAWAQDLPAPLVRLSFDEGRGTIAHDSSGNGLDAEFVGGANWSDGVSGQAAALDGRTRLRIADSTRLSLGKAMTMSLWVRGSALPFRIEHGQHNTRAPYFQVAGERILLATNADLWPAGAPGERYANVDWPLLVGEADISLAPWRYERKTERPMWGIEPKFQLVGDRIHLEYFGGDKDRDAQIFTARSDAAWRDWALTQQTHVKDHRYGVEQAGNVQVVGDRLYTGYPRKDSNRNWQLVTMSCALDGSDLQATERTSPEGGWIPTVQVWGNHVYYLYPTSPGVPGSLRKDYSLIFARADLDGGNWTVLRKISTASYDSAVGWGNFQISDGVVYLQYQQIVDAKTQHSALYTATMQVDGSAFRPVRRTFDRGFFGPNHNSVQVVGDKVYYVFFGLKTKGSAASRTQARKGKGYEIALDPKQYEWQYWTATSKRDGSDWRPQLRIRTSPADDAEPMPGYRAIQVVGGKSYLSIHRIPHDLPRPGRIDEMLAVTGANLISKGDAFGIGLTEAGEARAFLNAGTDYAFRGEAPANLSGAIADAAIDARWHQLAMSYDGAILSLFVDGKQVASAPYARQAAANPFPLLIGDGFRGVLDELKIWDQALPADTIRASYDAEHARLTGN